MADTIEKVLHNQCTGCGACYNKCPVNAITMEYDDEGFIFPKITDACINCGQCAAVCPVLKPAKLNETPPCYAVWASDDIRLKSSSGGMFTLLANYILKNNGVVCGAAYTEDNQTVHHIWATNKDELAPLRGSKYVQSETEFTFREAKSYLEQGKEVLYVGCPCQIAGLYGYLGKEYPNLYTADLVCHGSNSIKAYRSFIKEFSGGQEIEKVDFRDKKYFQWSTPTTIYLKNGEVKKAAWNESTWNIGFLNGIFNRWSCHECAYAKTERVADITMADCWQVHRINPAFDDRKGTSLVLVNTPKGRDLFHKIRHKMKLCESISLEFIKQYNGALNHPFPAHPSRKFFFSHIDDMGYHRALWYGRGRRFDVGIVGWWFASNYGSSLTYYALGTILENMGKQVIMIPIAKVDGNPWEPEIKFTVDFLSKYFHIAKNRTYDKMYEFNQFCDSFMLGSDQMWTAASTGLVGYTFFLDFVDKNRKKIAFSTSFGQSDFHGDEEMCATAGDYLKRFDAISVREQSGVDVCKNRFGVEAEQIIDPVFLCERKDYDKMVESVNEPINKKYLLCYILDPTPEKEKAAKAIAKRENLEILTILGLKEYKHVKDKWNTGTVLPQITSEQFLYYIKNCSYLMTDSHHGTCFGIIYEKPYAALVNAGRGATRFETVADALGLRERLFMNPLDVFESDRAYKAIDYNAVAERLEKEKVRAFEWLNNALSCPAKVNEDTIRTIATEGNRKVTGMATHIRHLEWRLKEKDRIHSEEVKKLQEELAKEREKNNATPSDEAPQVQEEEIPTQEEKTEQKNSIFKKIFKK